MNREEFNKAILEIANEYVEECFVVGDKQAEEMIRYDFLAGADEAYNLLTKQNLN